MIQIRLLCNRVHQTLSFSKSAFSTELFQTNVSKTLPCLNVVCDFVHAGMESVCMMHMLTRRRHNDSLGPASKRHYKDSLSLRTRFSDLYSLANARMLRTAPCIVHGRFSSSMNVNRSQDRTPDAWKA